MEQLNVTYQTREPNKHEQEYGCIEVVEPTLRVQFYDGEKWFAFRTTEAIYRNSEMSVGELKDMIASIERRLYRGLVNALQEGEVDVHGVTVKIYGVAGEPIIKAMSLINYYAVAPKHFTEKEITAVRRELERVAVLGVAPILPKRWKLKKIEGV